MPPTFTYPGVYIEEIPSGVHTITGVATSIAAFVGWAAEGPTNKATLVQSWADFENQFGGLDTRSLLGYSVNQFFGNGGQQAYIVRLVAPDARSPARSASPLAAAAQPSPPTPTIPASGRRSTAYASCRTRRTRRASRSWSSTRRLAPQETVVESFTNLSMLANDPLARSVESVINDPRTGSQLIQLSGVSTTPGVLPAPNALTAPGMPPAPYMLVGGVDGTVLDPATPAFHTALNAAERRRVHLLDTVPIFNLLCVPGETRPDDDQQAAEVLSRQARVLHRRLQGDRQLQFSAGGPRRHHGRRRHQFRVLLSRGSRRRIRCSKAASSLIRRAASSPASTPPRTPRAACGKRRRASTRACRASRAQTVLTDLQNGTLNIKRSTACADSRCTAMSSGARARCAATIRPARNGSTSRSAGWRCSSNRACTTARSGWSSSPTTNACGARSG